MWLSGSQKLQETQIYYVSKYSENSEHAINVICISYFCVHVYSVLYLNDEKYDNHNWKELPEVNKHNPFDGWC